MTIASEGDAGRASAPTDSHLYDRVGDARIAEIVDVFYARVLADPRLAPFFVGAPLDHLRGMQREFFAAALGGPIAYSGTGIREKHAHLGIGRDDFSHFVEHLTEALAELGVDDEVVVQLTGRLGLYVDDIVGGQGEGG